MSVYRVHNAVPKESRRGHQIPGTGVMDVYEVPCGCSKPNHSPLREQPLLLTTDLVHINLKMKHPTLNFSIEVEV